MATAIAVGSCGEETITTPGPSCEFSGITAVDDSGVLIGPEDPDDWCAGVLAMPNPASRLTLIRFGITKDQHVEIEVHSAEQGHIRTLVDDTLPAGQHAVDWNMTSDSGDAVAPGIYCVTVSSDEYECSGDIEVR